MKMHIIIYSVNNFIQIFWKREVIKILAEQHVYIQIE